MPNCKTAWGKKTVEGNTSETPSKRNSRGQKSCWNYTGACSGNEEYKILGSGGCLVLSHFRFLDGQKLREISKETSIVPIAYELNQVWCVPEAKVFH